MLKTESANTAETLKRFTDVLYLTNSRQMPPEIKLLLKQKRLFSLILSIDEFSQIRQRLDLVGTVIIDTMILDVIQNQKLAHIIECLEIEKIGTILLSGRVNMPVKSFSLAPSKVSFSLTNTMESVSIDDLWVRISVNLAYRKKSCGITVKPAGMHRQVQMIHGNKLADQFSSAESLVCNLAEQLRMAGLVQRDFLPAKLPECDQIRWATIFMPAEWVSGDIYDAVRLDEQHIAFYIVDAVGHSMPAALLTIFIKQAMVMRESSGNSYHIFSPAEVMQNLNLRMAGQKLSGYQFATCCYCLLNTRTMQLTYARAGHPYPLLLKGNKKPELLEVRGSLLGIFEQAEYTQQTVQLEPGDKVFLYSDGAESFIGSIDDKSRFNFTEGFSRIADMPIIEMMEEFNILTQKHKIDPSEVDDITAVGLEIL